MSSGGEGEWPTVDELKKSLDMPNDDFDSQLDRHLDAAIEQVKLDVGDWDDVVDEPDASLAQAALLLGIRIAQAPAAEGLQLTLFRADAAYQRLLKGHRRRHAIA